MFTSVVPVTCAVFPQGLEGGRAERGGGGAKGSGYGFPVFGAHAAEWGATKLQ